MEEPFLTDSQSEAKSKLEEIKMEIRFLNSALEQLEDQYEEFYEEKTYGEDGESKIREGRNSIKSIQLLINDFKYNNPKYTNWDEFKRSEREFNELVDVFNTLMNPISRKQTENLSEDYCDNPMDEETGYGGGMSTQQTYYNEQPVISQEQILDMDEIIKERGDRIDNINQNAATINSMATEINHNIYSCDNILDNVVKNTFDANEN